MDDTQQTENDGFSRYESNSGNMTLVMEHSGPICLVAWMVMVLVDFIDLSIKYYPDIVKMFPWGAIYLGLLVILPTYLFFRVAVRRMAHRVIFDLPDKKLTLWIINKKEPLCIPISEIQSIRLDEHVMFKLVDGRVFQGLNKEKRFTSFLKQNGIKYEWGKNRKAIEKWYR